MKSLTRILLLLSIFLFATHSYAQVVIEKGNMVDTTLLNDSTSSFLVKLIDDSEFTGTISSHDDISLVLLTHGTGTEITIPYNKIKLLERLEPELFEEGQYWFKNPNPTRYLFGPSGFNLEKGKGYVHSIFVVYNSVSVGVTDHFSIGVGTEFISLFEGYPMVVLTPKFGGYTFGENIAAGGGALVAFAEGESFGIAYGVVTRGDANSHITFGTGLAFSGDEISEDPIVTFSAMHRFRKNAAFITENWFFPGLADDFLPNVVSAGFRFFGERFSVDLSLVNTLTEDMFLPGLPYLAFAYEF